MRNGHQRFKCKSCGILFTRNRPEQKEVNCFCWFKKWILERQVYKTLSRDSGMSQSSLQRLFRKYLGKAPTIEIRHKTEACLLVDATYFPNGVCLVVYYQNDIKHTQLYRLTSNELYVEIREDLENLRNMGIHIKSVTCDGHRAILKAVNQAFPGAILQRCVVHVKRQCRTWLTQHPKNSAGLDLLSIVNRLTSIKTVKEANQWVVDLNVWYEYYKIFLEERVYNPKTDGYWYKHKTIRKSMTLIRKALPCLFMYLYYPEIPHTTNRLEGFFGHLKEKLNLHRGLSKIAKKNFIRWYLHLCNQAAKDKFS